MTWVMMIHYENDLVEDKRIVADVGYYLTYSTPVEAEYDDSKEFFVPIFSMKNIQSAIELCNYLNGGNGDSTKSIELLQNVERFEEVPLFDIPVFPSIEDSLRKQEEMSND